MVEPTLVESAADRPRDDVAGREITERVLGRHERLALVVAQDRAFAAQRFREQRARHRRMVQRRRVELHELEIGDRDPGAERHRDAVAGGQGRVRGDREALPRAPGCDDGVRGAQDALGTVGIENDHAGRAAVLDEEVGGEPTLVHLGPRLLHRDRQRPFDLGSRRIAARVDDPRHRVAALARERECSVDDVEVGAERHELADAIRTFGREHTHRVGVVEPATRGERVGSVQLG